MAESQSNDQRPVSVRSGPFWPLRIIVAVLLVGVIAVLLGKLLPYLQGPGIGPESHRGVGEKLTYVELEPLLGDPPPISTTDLEGRVTLLNFWGPWCPPCRAELPHMADLKRQFAGQPFQLIAISYPAGPGNDVESLRKESADVLKRLDVDLPTYHDLTRRTIEAVNRVIGFEGFPTNVLLDRRGIVRAVWVGYEPGVERQIEERVIKLLAESSHQ